MEPLQSVRALETRRSTEAPVLRLEVFGGPRAFRDHVPLSLSPSFSAVLLLLDERGESGLPRQTVCDLLWPPEDETLIRHRFSQLLYGLNRKLGPGIKVSVEDELVVMEEGELRTDLQEFRQCIALGQLAAAKAFLDRDYAPLLDSGIPRPFLDWIEARRMKVRAQVRERAAAIWSQAEKVGQWPDALGASQVMLELDPWDEGVLRNFIWAHASVGRVAEARAAYRSFVERSRLVSEDPAWTASRETQDLVARAKTIGDAYTQQEGAPLAAPPQIPFTGRREELARIARAVRRTPREDAEVLIVTGEAGAGKSRILEEALRSAPLDGFTVLKAYCSELEREVPLGPLLDALSGVAGRRAIPQLEEPWRSVMLGLLPSLHTGPGPVPSPPSLQPDALSRRLLEAIRQTLLQINDAGPLILVVEDVHWLDGTSAKVLDYLRRRWDSEGLTLVLADRPESRIPGSAAERLVRSLLAERWNVEVVELGELEAGESLELIRQAHPTEISEAAARRILQRGGPNPFFLVELSQAPELPEDRLVLGAVTPIPKAIEEVLAPRIEALSEPARRILLLLSVIQLSIAPKTVSRLLGLGLEETLSALEEMADARILDWERNRAYIRHALIREMTYCRISPARLAWLHGRAGAFLEARRPDCPPGDLSLHFYRAGETEKALEYAILAADQAEESGSGGDAIQYLFVALEICEDGALEADILNRLGGLLHQAGHYRDAEEILERAIPALAAQGRIADSLLAESTRCDALSLIPGQDPLVPIALLVSVRERARDLDAWEPFFITWDVELHIRDRMGDVEGAAALLEALEEIEPPDDPLAQSLWHAVLSLNWRFGDPSLAPHHARATYELALQAGQDRQIMRALNRLLAVKHTQAELGDEEGEIILAEADRRAAGQGDLDLRSHLRGNRGVWLSAIDEFDRAEGENVLQRVLLRNTRAAHLLSPMHYNRGENLLFMRDFEGSLAEFRAGEALLGERISPQFQAVTDAGIGITSLLLGNLSEARRRFEAIAPVEPSVLYDASLVGIFRARYLSTYGEIDQAIEELDGAAQAIKKRYLMGWARVTEEKAMVLHKQGRPGVDETLRTLEEFWRSRKLASKENHIGTLRARISD